MSDKIKVLDCKQYDNEYLHKDFHGALCYAIKYLDEKYGPDTTSEYLEQVGRATFTPLIEELKKYDYDENMKEKMINCTYEAYKNKTGLWADKVIRTYWIEELKKDGLIALERHFKRIFKLEAGHAEFELQNGQLTITVLKCPAILHLLTTKQLFTERYCQTTVNINKAICEAAGFECSCDYKPSEGCCVQRFWRKGENKK